MARSGFTTSALPFSHFFRISTTFLNQFYPRTAATLAPAGESPTGLQLPKYHHHDHLAAGNQSGPTTTLAAGTCTLFTDFSYYCRVSSHFLVPMNSLLRGRPPRWLPLVETIHLRLAPTLIVAAIVVSNVIIFCSVFSASRLFFRPTSCRTSSATTPVTNISPSPIGPD